jgi:hypothetical protein
MADSIQVWPPGFRVTDANDDPVPLGTVEFYNAGTSTPQTVYSDQDLSASLGAVVYLDSSGSPVASSGSSTKVAVYVGTADYKTILKDGDGSILETKDNLKGAINTAPFEASSEAIPIFPVITKSADYTVLTTDQGKVINVDSTAATRTITLPSAVTAGDNWCVIIRHVGSANEVTIATVSSQTISIPLPGGAATSFNLTSYAETITLVSDGANWHVISHVLGLKLGSGYHSKVHDLGTITSGTVTPDPENGNKQKLTNNGAFTLAPPSEACVIELWVTNAGSAGTITTSGFTVASGDSLNTTDTNKFRLTISTDDDGNSTLERRGLQ